MAMKRIILIVLVAMTFTKSSASVLTQSDVSSVLQNILSPANTEKAMQLIQIAASRSNRVAIPEIARGTACRELPARCARNDYLPARAVAREMPVRVIAGDSYARVYPETVQKVQVPMREIKQFVQPNLMDSLVLPREIFQAMVPKEVRPCQALAPAANPYLPLASPVSAVSPINMPPPTQSRGQFLRKIPIPPPTL